MLPCRVTPLAGIHASIDNGYLLVECGKFEPVANFRVVVSPGAGGDGDRTRLIAAIRL